MIVFLGMAAAIQTQTPGCQGGLVLAHGRLPHVVQCVRIVGGQATVSHLSCQRELDVPPTLRPFAPH